MRAGTECFASARRRRVNEGTIAHDHLLFAHLLRVADPRLESAWALRGLSW